LKGSEFILIALRAEDLTSRVRKAISFIQRISAPSNKAGFLPQVLYRFAGEIIEGEQAAEDLFSSLLVLCPIDNLTHSAVSS
jgi:hypothetical protein